MEKMRQAGKTWLGTIGFLVGLFFAAEALPGQFPPKQMCLVDKTSGSLLLMANCKLAGPSVKLKNGSYKIYQINALTEGGPLSGSGAFLYPGYFDISLTGGGSNASYHYIVDIRLDPDTRDGTMGVKNIELDHYWAEEVRLVPCITVP